MQGHFIAMVYVEKLESLKQRTRVKPLLVNPPAGNRLRHFPSDNQQPGLQVSMRQKEGQAIDWTRVGPRRADEVSVLQQILSDRVSSSEYSWI